MFEGAPKQPHIQPPASIIECVGLTPSRLPSQALALAPGTFFSEGSAVTASVTAERARYATLGYATRAPIKARFNEERSIGIRCRVG